MKKIKIEKQTLEKLISEGYSVAKIAEILEYSDNTIRRNIKKYELELPKTKSGNTIRRAVITLDYLKQRIESNPDDWDYILGLFITDGNIINNQIRMTDIADKNLDMLLAVNDFLENKLNIHRNFRNQQQKYYNSIAFKNQDIVDFLKEKYLLTPNKTFTIKAPYMNWNVLRGIFDGDGCIHKENKGIHCYKLIITSASEYLISQIVEFLNSQDIDVSISEYSTYKNIIICKKAALQIIFNNFYKDAKYYIKHKYNIWCPSFGKPDEQNSVNSVKSIASDQTEPSL